MEASTNPVVIWKYSNSEVLVFWDKSGIGRYALVYDKFDPKRSDARFKQIIPQ
jgi:hypothetical protein